MLDFQKELDKLLAQESEPLPQDLTSLIKAGSQTLTDFGKKQTDISIQIEEIYDIIKDADALEDALGEEKENSTQLVRTVVGLCDIIEDFCAFAVNEEALSQQAAMMWKNAGALLERCAISRIGERGQPLDPAVHTVLGLADGAMPEHVAQVVQSGYRYMGIVVRKAAVLISKGVEDPVEQNNRY